MVTLTLPRTQQLATSEYPLNTAVGHIALLKPFVVENYSFAAGDVNTSNGELTLPSNTYAVGTRVRIAGPIGGTFFASQAGTTLKVSELPPSNPDSTDFVFSNQVAGTIQDLAPELISTGAFSRCQEMADLIRYESTAIAARPTWTPTEHAILDNRLKITGTVTIDNSAGPEISISGWALIRGGNATPGNTGGIIESVELFNALQTLQAGIANQKFVLSRSISYG